MALAISLQKSIRRARRGGLGCLFRDLRGAAALFFEHSPEDVLHESQHGSNLLCQCKMHLYGLLVVALLGLA